jgi:hypothetical protein
MMEHFSEQVWADFVRRTGSPEGHAELESHLANGCKDCATTRKFWQQIQQIASLESKYSPPEAADYMAKVEFAARPAHEVEETTATVIFDSFSQPLLAGVRSVAPAAARQMVYEADGLTVDLRFDSQAHPNKVHLIGQILDKRAPRTNLDEACVMLWTERGLPVVETRTNNLGEFTMEFADLDNLRLSIQVGRTHIRIPLTNLTARQNVSQQAGRSDIGNR